MKRISVFIFVLVGIFLLSSCTPKGGYTDSYNGLIVSKEGTQYIWIPEIGNVLLPYSDRTTLVDSEEQYELKVGDWVSITFWKNEDEVYIIGDDEKSFVSDAASISVSDSRGHNISIIEVDQNVELTIDLIDELYPFEVSDSVYLFHYDRNDNGDMSLSYYTNYTVINKTEEQITFLIPVSEVGYFMENFLFEGFEFGDSIELP